MSTTSVMTIDIYQLFIALLTTALLQEFAIRPSVDFIKKYYRKGREHIEKMIPKNGDKT